jgi:hypothetical protein
MAPLPQISQEPGMKRKKSDIVQLSKIRMREELRHKLSRDAERNAKTLNGEIVDRLEKSYQARYVEKITERALLKAAAASVELTEKTADAPSERSGSSDAIPFAARVVEVLLGGNKLKSDLLRLIANELAAIPDELLLTSHRHLVERALARFEQQHGVTEP